MSCVHPEGLARTERLDSAGTKMTCHTLKCVESVQTSSLFTRLMEHQKKRERDYRWKCAQNPIFPLAYPGKLGGGGHVTPAFPFCTLINVALSSKCNCNRCFSALIEAFSRLSRWESSHKNYL